VADGRIKPVVHASYPLAEAARAHADVEGSANVGKVLLTTG
jgi:NADPH:quinone reductase-like Zn-dependent oxidoreductase